MREEGEEMNLCQEVDPMSQRLSLDFNHPFARENNEASLHYLTRLFSQNFCLKFTNEIKSY